MITTVYNYCKKVCKNENLIVFFVVQGEVSNDEFFVKSSELFENPVYLEEVADVLCILQAGNHHYQVAQT